VSEKGIVDRHESPDRERDISSVREKCATGWLRPRELSTDSIREETSFSNRSLGRNPRQSKNCKIAARYLKKKELMKTTGEGGLGAGKRTRRARDIIPSLVGKRAPVRKLRRGKRHVLVTIEEIVAGKEEGRGVPHNGRGSQ